MEGLDRVECRVLLKASFRQKKIHQGKRRGNSNVPAQGKAAGGWAQGWGFLNGLMHRRLIPYKG